MPNRLKDKAAIVAGALVVVNELGGNPDGTGAGMTAEKVFGNSAAGHCYETRVRDPLGRWQYARRSTGSELSTEQYLLEA